MIRKSLSRLLRGAADVVSPPSKAEIQSQPGVGVTDSGKNVNTNTSLSIGTVWACVRLLSDVISTLPIQLFERTADGKRALKYDHDLYSILHDSPNADMSAVDFWSAMQTALELRGNAYALKLKAAGDIIGLDMLKPDGMKVSRDKSGRLIYEYSDSQRSGKYTEDDILHIKGFTLDGVLGMSTLAYAKNTLGLSISADSVASETFKNGLRPSSLLQSNKLLSPEQREAYYSRLAEWSSRRAGSALVLELGETLTPINLTPEDAQLLGSREFSVEDVCRWFGVPPFMIGHTQKSTSWGTGLEQQNIGFLTYTLSPRLRRIEQSISRSLIPPEDRRRYFAEFNIEGLLRADSGARASFYSQVLQNGVMSRNEVREKENLQPVPGADVLTVQSNLIPIDKVGTNYQGNNGGQQ